MDTTLVQLSAVGLGLVPVVMGLTAIFKSFVSDGRYAPIASLVLGIALAFVVPAATAALTILQGVLIGLTASGLYSGVKAIAAPAPIEAPVA